MSFDRRWLEPQGSEDSHGRTLWALGATARYDVSEARRHWAAGLSRWRCPRSKASGSPRAWAFALLVLDDYCAAAPDYIAAMEIRARLADRLLVLLRRVETPDWYGSRRNLAYEQCALLRGDDPGRPRHRQQRLAQRRNTQPRLAQQPVRQRRAACFVRLATESFYNIRSVGPTFDQQPLEATATMQACLVALRATSERRWKTDAYRRLRLVPRRQRSVAKPLFDPETGSCRDGLLLIAGTRTVAANLSFPICSAWPIFASLSA